MDIKVPLARVTFAALIILSSSFLLYVWGGRRDVVQNCEAVPINLSPSVVNPRGLSPAGGGEEVNRVHLALSILRDTRSSRLTEVTHTLRLWGAETPSGRAIFDSKELERVTGIRLHRRTAYGLSFESAAIVGKRGEMHAGQVLASLSDAGTLSSQPVRVDTVDYTVQSIIRHELANVTTDAVDLPWITTGLARYVPLDERWKNKHGDVIDFDALTLSLCSRKVGSGYCYGSHDLYALAVILAIDDQQHRLSFASRQAATARLEDAGRRLRQTQKQDGGWGADWHMQEREDVSRGLNDDDRAAPLVVTAHTLEWIAYYRPSPVQQDTIRRAHQFVLKEIVDSTAAERAAHYCPYMHAGNALRLWLCEPYERVTLKQIESSEADRSVTSN